MKFFIQTLQFLVSVSGFSQAKKNMLIPTLIPNTQKLFLVMKVICGKYHSWVPHIS